MSNLPDATLTILDGQLGLVPPSVANASAKLGICSSGVVGQIYSLSSIPTLSATIGQGPLAEAVADTLTVAGGPVYAVPINPTTAGTAGAVTHLGTGAGTVTPSVAPAVTVDLKIAVGGTLGTMTFQYRLNGAAYSAPVATSGGPFSFLIPGTLTTVTFAAGQTWVANDVYTISTAGVRTLVGTGPAATNITQASSPLDTYDILITIATSGGLGAGVFTYSVDGGNNTSSSISIPAGGVYVIPGTGVVLTFASTFVATDTYEFTTATASFSTSDANTAMTTLGASPVEWGFLHIVGMASNAAGAASLAGVVDGKMTAFQTAFRYVFGAIECPTVESDSAVASAFSNFSSLRTMVGAGDVGHISQLTGNVIRRNVLTVATSRMADINPGTDAAKVKDGPLSDVKSIYRDEAKTEFLDALGFTTARTFVGKQGYFLTNARMMAPGGSGFTYATGRRVMDVACRVARAKLLDEVNDDLLLNPAGTPNAGKIYEPEALRIERAVAQAINAAVVATKDASGVTVVVDRSENILSTNHLTVTISLVPKGYARKISVIIAYSNPALG